MRKGEATTDADAPGQGHLGHPVPLDGGLKAGGMSRDMKNGWTTCHAVLRWKVTRTPSLDFLSNFEGSNGEDFSDPSGHWRANCHRVPLSCLALLPLVLPRLAC